MSKEEKPELPQLFDQIQLISGRFALWRLSQRFFLGVAAAIFAAVIQQPKVPKTVPIAWFTLREAILWYLTVGIFGLFMWEIGVVLRLSLLDPAEKDDWEPPEFIKGIFVCYAMIGLLIVTSLLEHMME